MGAGQILKYPDTKKRQKPHVLAFASKRQRSFRFSTFYGPITGENYEKRQPVSTGFALFLKIFCTTPPGISIWNKQGLRSAQCRPILPLPAHRPTSLQNAWNRTRMTESWKDRIIERRDTIFRIALSCHHSVRLLLMHKKPALAVHTLRYSSPKHTNNEEFTPALLLTRQVITLGAITLCNFMSFVCFVV